jgi:hypothetical protein
MYRKAGTILRVETTVNNPRQFLVPRPARRGRRRHWTWRPMKKSVTVLPSLQQAAARANRRYLEALSPVHDPAPAWREVHSLTRSMVVAGRSYAGFNPAKPEDVALFQAVLDGELVPHGFYNADIRRRLFGTAPDPLKRRQQAQRVSRLLKRLHVRGLIARVPRTHRWRVTTKGYTMLGVIVCLYHDGLPQAA